LCSRRRAGADCPAYTSSVGGSDRHPKSPPEDCVQTGQNDEAAEDDDGSTNMATPDHDQTSDHSEEPTREQNGPQR
jgi:hypothetical protein